MLGETLASIRKREREEANIRKERLKNFVSNPSTGEKRLISELAQNQQEREILKNQIEELRSIGVDETAPELTSKIERVKELDSYDSIISRAWTDRFGSPGRDEAAANRRRLKELIDDGRELVGTLDPEKLKSRLEARELNDAKNLAASMDQDEIVS